MRPILVLVEVLPGVELALFLWEDADKIASQLEAFFDEVERRPGMADELTDSEAVGLGLIGENQDGEQ